MEFNPYRRYAMMITVKMITDDYTAVYNIFSEAVDLSQVFIERKIMNLEKKYRIIKISFILVSCLFFIVLYAIGTYVSERKEEHRFAKGIRGTYTSADSFTNISLDDEDQLYYLSGDRVSHGTYKKLNEQVFKLLSGHLKDAYIVKDSNGDIILIEQDTSAARFKKYDNQITIVSE